MTDVRRALRGKPFAFALVVAVVLAAANIAVQPSFVAVDNWPADIANFAPFMLLAMASTPSILSGRGGLDVSLGPVAGLISIVLARYFLGGALGGPEICVPVACAIGCLGGAISGVAIAKFRYPPIIATLAAYFVAIGIGDQIAQPVPVPPNWTTYLAGTIAGIPGGLFLMLPCAALWICLRRTPFPRTLLAVGGNDAAAYSAGVNVSIVRILAYTLGGLCAGVAGVAIIAIVQTGDPSIGPGYTLSALAAVMIGGTRIGGGRGGMFGSVIGAAAIFLVQNLLDVLHVSSLWGQGVYGAMLLLGLLVASTMSTPAVGATA
jgi:ribose transport system permease protein